MIFFLLVFRMPMKTGGSTGLAVIAGDVLALRGTGLAAAETWALLCQAAQALQDLFLSSEFNIFENIFTAHFNQS